jgi:hypothetical protein
MEKLQVAKILFAKGCYQAAPHMEGIVLLTSSKPNILFCQVIAITSVLWFLVNMSLASILGSDLDSKFYCTSYNLLLSHHVLAMAMSGRWLHASELNVVVCHSGHWYVLHVHVYT